MDKDQKELIKSYFRIRRIAETQGQGQYNLTPYELEYEISHGMVDPDNLSGPNIVGLIQYDSKFINDFGPEVLAKLNGNDIIVILDHQPSLYDKLNVRKIYSDDANFMGLNLYVLDKEHLDLVMKLIKLGLTGKQAYMVLNKRPDFIEYIHPEDLRRIDPADVEFLLGGHQELRPYFK